MAVVVSYTTVSMMNQTLAEVGSISTLTTSVMLFHAQAAETIINAKLSGRYSLPFTSEIPVLQTLATDMAIYRILTGRIIVKEDHPWFARYRDAAKLLDSMAKGEMPLITSSGEVVGARSDDVSAMQPWSNTQDYKPTFWEGPWTLQEQDDDKIDDEADDRDFGIYKDRLK